jgi:hypothetical protein
MADKFVYLKAVDSATYAEWLYILRDGPLEDIDQLLEAWKTLNELSETMRNVLGVRWEPLDVWLEARDVKIMHKINLDDVKVVQCP